MKNKITCCLNTKKNKKCLNSKPGPIGCFCIVCSEHDTCRYNPLVDGASKKETRNHQTQIPTIHYDPIGQNTAHVCDMSTQELRYRCCRKKHFEFHSKNNERQQLESTKGKKKKMMKLQEWEDQKVGFRGNQGGMSVFYPHSQVLNIEAPEYAAQYLNRCIDEYNGAHADLCDDLEA